MFVPGGKVQLKQSGADLYHHRVPKVFTVLFCVGRSVHTNGGVFHRNELEVGSRSGPPSRAQHPFGNDAWNRAIKTAEANAKAKKK